MSRNQRKIAGLTLMEIVISLGIVAVLTLFVMGVMTRLLFTGGKTAHQAAANLLAEEVLEGCANVGPPTWGFFDDNRNNWNGHRQLTLPGEDTTTFFQYQVEEVTLGDSPEDLGTFHELKVTVWWWNDSPSSRPEQGNLFVEGHRKVYVRR